MKKNYKYLILFSILFFYGLLMFFYFSNKKKKELFVVVDNYAVFNYDNKKWYNIILNSRNINDYSWKKYNVYLNGNSIGKKILWFDEKWYLFDLKHNPINYSDPLLGIHNTYDYDIKYLNVDDTIVDYSDKNFIIEILSYGIALAWIEPKVNSLTNISQMFGSSAEKWYSQSMHLNEIRSLRDDLYNKQRSLIRDRGYSSNDYLDGASASSTLRGST